MIAIQNATLVMPDHLIPDATLLIQDGKIRDFGKRLTVPEGYETIDAQGKYLAPGLVDIHTHAGGDAWFYEEPARSAENLLQCGVTTVLPALYAKFDKVEYVKKVNIVLEAYKKGEMPNFGGLYMEGPYLNPGFGSSDPESITSNPWVAPIASEDYMPLVRACGDLVRVWCVAPEREHIEDFIRDAKKENPAVRFAVAHSEATTDAIEALIPYGLSIGTHHTNATGTLQKYPECRTPCVDETVNYNDSIYAEIISDSLGVHVDPYIQRLTRKIKQEKIILISDACTYDFTPPAELAHITDLCIDERGEIQGSRVSLDAACRNWMVHTGAGICEVFRFASLNPARATGFTDRGEIRKGLRADLILCDHKINVERVFLEGAPVK